MILCGKMDHQYNGISMCNFFMNVYIYFHLNVFNTFFYRFYL